MKKKKRDMTYNELQEFLYHKYNNYANASINESIYNYDNEFSNELYIYKELCDFERKSFK